MKTVTLSLLYVILAIYAANAQTASSCSAPDSIVANYKDDADRLALRKFFRNNLPYKDSVIIPASHADTALRALIAVYNSNLPAKDTVVTMFNIHTFPDYVMNALIVAADSNLAWMNQLRNGNIPTGNATVDALLSAYHLSITSYSDNFHLYSWHSVVFQTDSNYNIVAMSKLFEAISGVNFAEPNGVIGDGNNITDSIYTDHVQLIYSLGWDDCPSGCISRRYWKFNIYFDCSVEYMGSYGSPLIINGITNELSKHSISISPNPFSDFIFVKGIAGAFDFSITDLAGKNVVSGNSMRDHLYLPGYLSQGLYILKIQSGRGIEVFKIAKEN